MASYIITTMKLIYGLNDIPYSLEIIKVSPNIIPKPDRLLMAQNMDRSSIYIAEISSLYSIFIAWEQYFKQNSNTFQIHNIGNIDKYYSHLSMANNYLPDKDLLISSTTNQEKKIINANIATPDINIVSTYIQEEIHHHRSENPEYPIPASEFWVQQKKASDKDYPCEYLFTLHSVAGICGDMSPKQINYICDRIDRYIAHHD